MLRLTNLKIDAHKEQEIILHKEICRELHIQSKDLQRVIIRKKSIDARKKEKIVFLYTVDVVLNIDENKVLQRCRSKSVSKSVVEEYQVPKKGSKVLAQRPIVVGAGPGGLFAAYLLAENGYRPILLERGKDVDSRTRDVEHFWQTGELNEQSNVQFGEGGAGTFSDGKLNTVIKDIRCRKVLETFVACGAPEDILYVAKPHVGTDRLKEVVKEMRRQIIAHGGEVRFEAQVTELIMEDGQIKGVIINDAEKLLSNHVILAIGHSARDTFAQLAAQKVVMEAKAFAIGVRMEHLQADINTAQYGADAPLANLGAADYKLTWQAANGRAVYSFCMCPGGTVVAAASEQGRLVVNGMSNRARDGRNANSALVVTVNPQDFPGNDPLAGVAFQRQWEELAYQIGGGSYAAPVQRWEDFVQGKVSTEFGKVQPSYLPQTVFADLRECLPPYVVEALLDAIPAFGKKIKGYDDKDALLTGVETRTSSPVRIVRDAEYQAIGIKGLYPCAEGAGYAGGIISAGVDGIRLAEKIIEQYQPFGV